MPNSGCSTNKLVQKGINTKTKGRRSVVNGKSKAYKAHLAQGNKNAALNERYAKKQEYEGQIAQEQTKAETERKAELRRQALQMQRDMGMVGDEETTGNAGEVRRKPTAAYLHMRNQRSFLKTVFPAPINCVKFESDVEEEEVVVFKHRAAMNAYFHRKVSDEEFEENEVLLQELKDKYCPMTAELHAMQQQELLEEEGEGADDEDEEEDEEEGEEEEEEVGVSMNASSNSCSSSSAQQTAVTTDPDCTSTEVVADIETGASSADTSGVDEVTTGTDALKVHS